MSAHPIKDFLVAHETAFSARYGSKPARYTAKDCAHAKALITDYGYDGALLMLKRFFDSRDAFVSTSGHNLAVLATSNVQNRLIAEAAPKRRTTPVLESQTRWCGTCDQPAQRCRCRHKGES